jgi:hypothetical protein
MPLVLWRLLTLLLVAMSMALSFCHLMEMSVRVSWEPTLWMQTTNFGGLYYLFGSVGAVIDVSAIIAAVTLCFLARRRFPSFYFTIVGAALMAIGLAVWFTFVAPMSAIMATWTPNPVPTEFISIRNQWEYSHAIIALIKIGGLSALLISVLIDTRRS